MFNENDLSGKITGLDAEAKLLGANLSDLIPKVTNVAQAFVDIYNSTDKINERILQVDKGVFGLISKFGLNAQAADKIKDSFGAAYNKLGLLGADLGTFVKTQEDFAKVNNRNVILSEKNLEELIATNKVTGIAADTLMSSFQNAGYSMSQISEQMVTVVKLASSMGVNSQTVSKLVTDNVEKLNKFGFGNGVEGLAKMAAKAASLRMDMTSTFKVAQDIFDRGPEAAIEISATLQRMGATSGALLDPLKLMDLAQNNLPELQNQLVDLSKQYTVFNEDTKQFEIMPGARKQLNEVAKSLGMNYEEFAKMSLESSKMEKKLSEIDFSRFNLDMSEEEKALVTNMAEMNESGEYVVKVKEDGKYIDKAISQLNQKDLEQLQLQTLSSDEQNHKEMYDIAKQNLSVGETMVNLTTTVANSLTTMLATGDYGTQLLNSTLDRYTQIYGSTSVESNAILSQISLRNMEMNKAQQDASNNMKEGFSALNLNTMEGAITAAEKFSNMSIGIFDKIVVPTAKAAGQNITAEGLITGQLAQAGAEIAKGFMGKINEILKDPAKFIGDLFKKQTGNDIAVTANGVHYSLDKGDMLMAINQQKLASAIGASTPSPILPTAVDNQVAFKKESKTISPKEINVNVNFTHEVSKGVDIDVAQQFTKSLRENTTLQQNLTRTIQETMSNLGLTSV